MPLSEEELRLLEQMERALAAEDPKFVSVLQGRGLERSARLRVISASFFFVVGLGVLFIGALAQMIAVMVLGFLVMLATATLGLHAWRGRHVVAAQLSTREGESMEFHPAGTGHPDQTPGARNFHLVDGGRRRPRRKPQRNRGQANRTQGTFMQRVEERWQRRRHDGR